MNRFLDAGYDLPFIAKQGLNDDDLDCIGIPMSKLGLRKKIKLLHRIAEFYAKEDEKQQESDEGEDENDENEEDADEEEEEED